MNLEKIIHHITGYRPGTAVKLFLISVFFGAVFILSHYIKKDALYDFDQVIYAACTFNGFEKDAEKVRQMTYASVYTDLGPDKFTQLTNPNNKYRNDLYKSADNLLAQLPFYKLKLIHVNLLRLGYQAGISPFRTPTYINLVCFVLMSVILLVFLTRRLNFITGWLAAMFIILMPAVSGTAKLNSPDLMTNLVFTAAVLALISSARYKQLSIVLFVLLIFIRPENMFLPLIFSILGLLLQPKQLPRRFFLVLGSLSVVSYLVLQTIVQPYPWWILYKHSFMGFISDPQNPQPAFSLMDYLINLKLVFRTATYSDFFITVFFLCFTMIAAAKKDPFVLIVALSVLLSLIARVLLFPDLSSRYFAGPFVASLILFICVVLPDKTRSVDENSAQRAPV